MDDAFPTVGYVNIEADTLLRVCFEQLGSQDDYEAALELILRGTLPRSVLELIEGNFTLIDSKGIQSRFSPRKRIFIDSWSELLNLGSLTYLYNSIQPFGASHIASIGLESAYRESSLRERFLGDGAIATPALNGRQIIQSCMAQNIRGKSAGKSLQQEVITRLQAKLASSPAEPERILAVTVVSETEDFDKLDFSKIAQETMEMYAGRSTYGPIFCIIPSVYALEPQITVVALADFLPGGSGMCAVIKSSFFMQTQENI